MSKANEKSAPTTLPEWNDGMPQLSKEELLAIFENQEKPIAANATIIYSHDHTEKAWELVEEEKLKFDRNRWAFQQATNG